MDNYVTSPVKFNCRNCGYKRSTRQNNKCNWCVSGVKVTPEQRQNVNTLFTNSLGVMYSGQMVLGQVK